MWPWWCCFYNESRFQILQFEEPKPPACESVPIPVEAVLTPPGERGQGGSAAEAEQGGSGPDAGCALPLLGFCCPDFKRTHRASQHFSAVKLLCSEHLHIFRNRAKLYSQS